MNRSTMDPLKIYDYLILTRKRVFDWVRPLSAEQYSRKFPTWSRTLGETLTHVMICEWMYIERMQQREVPPYDEWPIQDEKPPSFAVLESTWTEQGARIREALGAVRDWSTELNYRVTRDDGRRLMITASPADIFTTLVLHEVHHRAQAMNMLRILGIAVDDIDFNAMTYKRRDLLPGE
jgi:uncharacterized damage-inducible protein DinB